MTPIELLPSDEISMVDAFRSESDRAAAVLSAGYAEAVLGLLLKSHMTDDSLSERIFGANGALQTFAQRIDFAQAYGYLPKALCRDLHLIRKIRNHFAHYPKAVTFEDEFVAPLLARLSAAKHITQKESEFVRVNQLRLTYLMPIVQLNLLYNSRVHGVANPAA